MARRSKRSHCMKKKIHRCLADRKNGCSCAAMDYLCPFPRDEMTPDYLLSARQVSRYTEYPISSLKFDRYEYDVLGDQSGTIPYVLIDGKVRYRAADMEKFFDPRRRAYVGSDKLLGERFWDDKRAKSKKEQEEANRKAYRGPPKVPTCWALLNAIQCLNEVM